LAQELIFNSYEKNMPFVRRGKTVYKKVGKKLVKKGTSASIAGAKRYLKALYVHSSN